MFKKYYEMAEYLLAVGLKREDAREFKNKSKNFKQFKKLVEKHTKPPFDMPDEKLKKIYQVI